MGCSTPGTGTNAATAIDPQRLWCARLWAIAEPVRAKDKSWTVFEIWCNAREILTETEEVVKTDARRLREVINQTKEKTPNDTRKETNYQTRISRIQK